MDEVAHLRKPWLSKGQPMHHFVMVPAVSSLGGLQRVEFGYKLARTKTTFETPMTYTLYGIPNCEQFVRDVALGGGLKCGGGL